MNKTVKRGRIPAYIDSLIVTSGKKQADIAYDAGFNNANTVSLIKTGKIPLPIDRVVPLARALNEDPARLMMVVLSEREPELYQWLREEGTAPLSHEEKQIIKAFHERFAVDEEVSGAKQIIQAIKSL